MGLLVRNIGTSNVFDHAPGEEFEIDCTRDQLWRLHEGGHLTAVGKDGPLSSGQLLVLLEQIPDAPVRKSKKKVA